MANQSTMNEERFAALTVEYDNASRAYKELFDPEGKLHRGSIWHAAHHFRNRPRVAALIEKIKDEAREKATIKIASLMQDLHDIATADPRELSRLFTRSCRNCWGVDYGYQWRNEEEFAIALAKANDKKQSLPTDAGGYGYDPFKDPNLACPHCMGQGIVDTHFADMSMLSEKARKLYKGVKRKKDGEIEVLMHDQMAARDMLHKMLGAYKETVQIPGAVTTGADAIAKDVSQQEAARAYLRLVS